MIELNHFVVMGVSGCGKSTVATLLAEHFNATVIEADDLHDSANIEKMQRGYALTDSDRWPWLERVAEAIHASRAPAVVSCSSLRRAYRQCLMDKTQVPLGFIHLHADKEVIARRMSNRQAHFMPVSLLDSQFQLLEPLESDELGVVVDISQTVEKVVDKALQFMHDHR